MGVLGLTPFLQKICPEVIKKLPDRFKGLRGKTIVFDGTLITQRLHFSQSPYKYRHVLGWYRLIKELDAFGVKAVCVFDGKERHPAKAQEAKRRKSVQRLAMARGLIESERLGRLRQLGDVIDQYHPLDDQGKLSVRNAFLDAKTRSQPPVLPPPQVQSEEDTVAIEDPGAWWWESLKNVEIPEPVVPPDDFHDQVDLYGSSQTFWTEELDDTRRRDEDILSEAQEPGTAPEPPTAPPESSHFSISEPYLSTEHHSDNTLPPFGPTHRRTSSGPISASTSLDVSEPVTTVETREGIIVLDKIASSLTSLYLDYVKSIPKLASLPPSPMPSGETAAPSEYVMSKTQHKLTLEEGKLWEHLEELFLSPPSVIPKPLSNGAEPNKALDDSELLPPTVTGLTERSMAMSESYKRTANPPSTRTYEESQEILRSLGIPVIESVGAFEAETLACSMVLSGLADYVASEDTDVLVYEVPLIRNITSRGSPLICVSGAEVRAGLQLSRSSYVDFALLLGTDFSRRIKNVGPTRALKFIREHGSIEGVIASEIKYPPRISAEEYLKQVSEARVVFNTLPPVPGSEILVQGERDDDNVKWVMEKYGLAREVFTAEDWSQSLDGNWFGDNPSSE